MVEPAVQLERFRKDIEQLTWKKFRFDSNPPDLHDWDISLVEEDQDENIDGKSDSSSDSDTSSSDSEGEKCVTTKKVHLQNDIGNSEEIFVGWTTHIQHAVRIDPSPKPGAPTFEGIAWRSMCGANMNFSHQPKSGLSFCRKPACMKAWSAMESGYIHTKVALTWIGRINLGVQAFGVETSVYDYKAYKTLGSNTQTLVQHIDEPQPGHL